LQPATTALMIEDCIFFDVILQVLWCQKYTKVKIRPNSTSMLI